jgi:hypothetical protein
MSSFSSCPHRIFSSGSDCAQGDLSGPRDSPSRQDAVRLADRPMYEKTFSCGEGELEDTTITYATVASTARVYQLEWGW